MATVAVVAGTAVVVVAGVVVAGRMPGFTLMVLSSRIAVVRVAGRVPYHPAEGSSASVQCSFLRMEGRGTIELG